MSKWTRNFYDLDNNKQEFAKDDKTLLVPCKIGGKYEIDDVLSSGGFGAILLARNTALNNRQVLIKTTLYGSLKANFSRKYDTDREEKIETLRCNLEFECEKLLEFRRGGESRMPSIVELVYDFSPQIYGPHLDKNTKEEFFLEELSQNEPYVVMQYIEGITLADYISDGIEEVLKRRNYSSYLFWERDVLEYIKDICVIMKNFHSTQEEDGFRYYYIYQDLKPNNIMLTYDKFITLIDFGGLLLVGREDGQWSSCYTGYGQPGVGTAGYMPPELRNNPESLDKRADIYTIGATMYSLLTGEDLTKLDSRDGWARIPVENLENSGRYTTNTIEIIKKATNLNKHKRYNKIYDDMETSIDASLRELNYKINKL